MMETLEEEKEYLRSIITEEDRLAAKDFVNSRKERGRVPE